MELKHGWFPQREPKPLEYPVCAGCKMPIIMPYFVTKQTEDGTIIAHDPLCLKRALDL